MLIQQCNKVPFYDSSKSSLFVVVCRDNNLAPQSFLIFSLVSWARFFSPFTQGLLKIWTMNYRFWLLEIELVLCWLKFNKCMSNIKVRGSGPQPRYTYIRKSFHKLKIRYWVIKDIRDYKSSLLGHDQLWVFCPFLQRSLVSAGSFSFSSYYFHHFSLSW